MFGRRKRSGSEDAEERDGALVAPQSQGAEQGEELEAPADDAPAAAGGAPAVRPSGWRVDGPFDASEVEDPSDGGRRISLGSVWLAGREGVELQLQVDEQAGTVEGATFLDGESGLEVRAFAAPRTEGIWDEVRGELLASLQEQGAGVEEGDGPFGTELRAALPAQLPDGSQGFQPLRFIGVDGPRWFLRGVVSGRGAMEEGAAAVLEDVFRDTVVVRGREPMAPRDPLPLALPAGVVPVPQDPGVPAPDAAGDE
ncbi:uncharacterized protein DUF3710 [Motilibacter rhizosphaerae]|uniref:Uncharacterized protein DUF3710 n=1 Tax=Motilibacter rhizosphaerae TaxID=598652 RepID=A0A4Q7NGK3_9ACTN|nr:DUF3710 domain-containing protein [Motilibacter rhizosphaerae]RZS82965.1 uncharacterized protein DUF3710 [Motilibacter rhizosphaerae]